MRGIYAACVLGVSLIGSILGGATSASAQFRIADDRGGQIGPYLHQFGMIRDSGSRVIIDGTCLSACTLVLGTVPKDRICVTPRANLGFHAAWDLGPNGRAIFSEEGTRLLWEIYPQNVRRWINRKGGLTPQMIYLRGKELASMYASCDPAGLRTAKRMPRVPSEPPVDTAEGQQPTLFAGSGGAM